MFEKITLVGVGLLGGSLAMAVRERRLASTVVGYVRRDASITECEQAGLAQFATRDLLSAVAGADLVVVCTPLGQMRELTQQFLPALKPGAIVSDVGSTKACLVRELEPIVRQAGGHFIGAHPMAGGERMGVSAARGDLFANAVCVLTPTRETPVEKAQTLADFWRRVGSRLLTLTPEKHDELVARCSHLPHLVAAQLATSVLDPRLAAEQGMLCANGFRDTTRIASGSPEMWRDIALTNRQQIGAVLGDYIAELERVRGWIDAGDSQALEAFFGTAKQRRDAWATQPTSASPE